VTDIAYPAAQIFKEQTQGISHLSSHFRIRERVIHLTTARRKTLGMENKCVSRGTNFRLLLTIAGRTGVDFLMGCARDFVGATRVFTRCVHSVRALGKNP
jgi:hypothetical protein